MRTEERDLAAFHVAFGLVGAAALVLRGGVPVGVVMTTLVLVYHLGTVGYAGVKGHRRWLRWWRFGALLSVCMVVPDAVLVEGLGTLTFPPDGVARVGPVPLYMAGLWAVPAVVIVAVAEAVAHRRGDAAGVVAALVTAVAVFGAAEAVLTLVPLWEPVGVTTVGGLAPYILPAELLLGWMVLAAVRWTRGARWVTVALVAALVAVAYTGAAATSWLLVERGLLG